MKNNLFIPIRLTVVCFLFYSGAYTAIMYGFSNLVPAQWSFHKSKEGFYENVGQGFSSDRYFWSRPSSVDYNAAGSCGSNKGPSNPEYLAQVQARMDSFLLHHPEVSKEQIPSDLVTASGSGLDPNISVQSAKLQVKRIAKMRNINESTIQKMIEQQTEKPLLGIIGIVKINVLKLNIALDKLN